jgi:hypothetical protein
MRSVTDIKIALVVELKRKSFIKLFLRSMKSFIAHGTCTFRGPPTNSKCFLKIKD